MSSESHEDLGKCHLLDDVEELIIVSLNDLDKRF